jgi:hypothetical protein
MLTCGHKIWRPLKKKLQLRSPVGFRNGSGGVSCIFKVTGPDGSFIRLLEKVNIKMTKVLRSVQETAVISFLHRLKT